MTECGADGYRLRIYTVQQATGSVTWRDVTIPSDTGIKITYTWLSYDGLQSVIVRPHCDLNAVHVMSTDGQYRGQLLSSRDDIDKPLRVAVDTTRRLMYVALYSGVIKVFELHYRQDNK